MAIKAFPKAPVKCKNSFISDNPVQHKYAVLMSKQFYFEQFSLAWICSLNAKNSKFSKLHFSSILPIDKTLSGATTPGQSEPGSDGSEGVLRIPQSSSITGTSPSDCLVSYAGEVLPLCREAVGGILQLQPTGQINIEHYTYIYIYIYCHPQAYCFVDSQLFNVARLPRCLP